MFTRLVHSWRDARSAWRGLSRFNALPREQRRIVFYAESEADWAFLGPVADALIERGESVLRVTSDANDPALQDDAFYVGDGGARTVLFRTLDADALVITLTDLESFHLKRSVHPVHYFYVFHSIASTHRVYREHAFDAYDTILCVGPHHLREIRRTEEVYGLPAKHLVPHGYGRLDTLMQAVAAKGPPARAPGDPVSVLVAPSWGECSLVEHGLEPLIDVLVQAHFRVTLRLHPMTRRHAPDLVGRLLEKYEDGGGFRFDPHINTTASLLDADIMISEWSGAPLEYAFARERPVIFIDTPAKVNNPNFGRIGLPCLEADIREQIGKIVKPDALHELPRVVRELVAGAEAWGAKIRSVREATVFNVGGSGRRGADVICETLGRGTAARPARAASG